MARGHLAREGCGREKWFCGECVGAGLCSFKDPGPAVRLLGPGTRRTCSTWDCRVEHGARAGMVLGKTMLMLAHCCCARCAPRMQTPSLCPARLSPHTTPTPTIRRHTDTSHSPPPHPPTHTTPTCLDGLLRVFSGVPAAPISHRRAGRRPSGRSARRRHGPRLAGLAEDKVQHGSAHPILLARPIRR